MKQAFEGKLFLFLPQGFIITFFYFCVSTKPKTNLQMLHSPEEVVVLEYHT